MKRELKSGFNELKKGNLTTLPGKLGHYFIRRIPILKRYLSSQATNIRIEKLLHLGKKEKADFNNISVVYVLNNCNVKVLLNSIFSLKKNIKTPNVIFLDLGNNSTELNTVIKSYLPKAIKIELDSGARIIEILKSVIKIESLKERVIFINEFAKFNELSRNLDKVEFDDEKNYCLDFIYTKKHLYDFYINKKQINFYENLNLFRVYFPVFKRDQLNTIDLEEYFKKDFEVLSPCITLRAFNEDFTSKNIFHDFFIRKYEYTKISSHGFINNYKFDFDKRVSIIILTRDKVDLLSKMIDSIEKSTYQNYEIIVVDHLSGEQSQPYLKSLKHKVIRYEGEYNFGYMNNFAAQYASGEVFAFLNNDMEVITPNWIEILGSFAVRDDVGAVGAKLVFKNNTIQHAGIRINRDFEAISHISTYEKDNKLSSELNLISSPHAVTGACVFIEKYKFQKVGGFGADYKVTWQDVDLCLKLEEKGYRTLFIPYVKLFHYESVTRKAHPSKNEQDDLELFKRKWKG